jgi:hypothetical protein
MNLDIHDLVNGELYLYVSPYDSFIGTYLGPNKFITKSLLYHDVRLHDDKATVTIIIVGEAAYKVYTISPLVRELL